MSDSLRPHRLKHARLPCPSPTPRAYSNSCPSRQWCHPIISSSVIPFSCLQSFPASGSFPMSQFFTSGGERIGASASASVLPMNIQDWVPLGWTGLISLLSKGLSRAFSNTTVQKHQFFSPQLSLWSNSHIHTWLLRKNFLSIYQVSSIVPCCWGYRGENGRSLLRPVDGSTGAQWSRCQVRAGAEDEQEKHWLYGTRTGIRRLSTLPKPCLSHVTFMQLLKLFLPQLLVCKMEIKATLSLKVYCRIKC